MTAHYQTIIVVTTVLVLLAIIITVVIMKKKLKKVGKAMIYEDNVVYGLYPKGDSSTKRYAKTIHIINLYSISNWPLDMIILIVFL